jgi:large subunit ribosomal protein L25
VEDFIVAAESRESLGTSASRNLREEGMIPANVYSKRNGSKAIALDRKGFVAKASRARTSQVFKFESDDSSVNGVRSIVKEIQKNYLNGSILHVDFLELHEDELVKVIIPLEVSGEAPGVKTQGGILAVSCHNIIVRCLPKDIPSVIEVDVSELRLGQRIRTGDLNLPEGLELRGNPKETVVSVVVGRAARIAAREGADGAAPAA